MNIRTGFANHEAIAPNCRKGSRIAKQVAWTAKLGAWTTKQVGRTTKLVAWPTKQVWGLGGEACRASCLARCWAKGPGTASWCSRQLEASTAVPGPDREASAWRRCARPSLPGRGQAPLVAPRPNG